MLTDVKGIRDANGRHLDGLRKDVQRMVKRGTISEGMLPKVHACLDALAGGVGKAHIVDGRCPMPFCWKFLLTKASAPRSSRSQ